MVDTFAIVPAQPRSLWVLLAVVGVVLFVSVLLLLAAARGARSSRFEISDAGLRIRGDLYGRFIPASKLRVAASRLVDLTATPDLEPRTRTAGTSVGGYQSGWFRLRNGEKALLYLTDRRHAVYIPTNAGFSLILSPQTPDAFLRRLQSLSGAQ